MSGGMMLSVRRRVYHSHQNMVQMYSLLWQAFCDAPQKMENLAEPFACDCGPDGNSRDPVMFFGPFVDTSLLSLLCERQRNNHRD